MKNGVNHYKVVFLGEAGSGKSSIAVRFARDEFYEFQEPTIGAAFLTQTINLDKGIVKMEIWDTAGQERYRSLAPMYYRDAKVAFIVYDVTNKDSLNKAREWIKEVRNKGEPNVIIVLFGNKMDVREGRKVDVMEGLALANEFNLIFSEVSAKTGENIRDIMIETSTELLKLEPDKPPDVNSIRFDNVSFSQQNKKCC
jgi:Ras-related protein Rab-5C